MLVSFFIFRSGGHPTSDISFFNPCNLMTFFEINSLFGCTRSSLQYIGSLVGACELLVAACGI